MKRNILAFLLILIAMPSFAKEMCSGYYITNANDTIWVKFKVRKTTFDDKIKIYPLQFEVETIDSLNKAHTFKPGEIKGFNIYTENDNYSFITTKNIFNESLGLSKDTIIFSNFVSDGYIKLFLVADYEAGYVHGGGAVKSLHNKYYLFKWKDDAIIIEQFFFKKRILKALFDNKELVKKIEDDVYGYDDMKKIISEYNSWKKAIDEKLK